MKPPNQLHDSKTNFRSDPHYSPNTSKSKKTHNIPRTEPISPQSNTNNNNPTQYAYSNWSLLTFSTNRCDRPSRVRIVPFVVLVYRSCLHFELTTIKHDVVQDDRRLQHDVIWTWKRTNECWFSKRSQRKFVDVKFFWSMMICWEYNACVKKIFFLIKNKSF